MGGFLRKKAVFNGKKRVFAGFLVLLFTVFWGIKKPTIGGSGLGNIMR